MSEARLAPGIHRTHGTSVCLMRGSRLEWAVRQERSTRQEHRRGQVLLNTSFTGKDEPTGETPAATLAMPPFVLRKRVEPVVPA